MWSGYVTISIYLQCLLLIKMSLEIINVLGLLIVHQRLLAK